MMYRKVKDLILVSFLGMFYYAVVVGLNGHLTKVPLGEYYFAAFTLAVALGVLVDRPSQLIEWPLCFLFGGTSGSLILLAILQYLGMNFTQEQLLYTISSTFAWFGVLAVTLMVGVIMGAMFKLSYALIRRLTVPTPQRVK